MGFRRVPLAARPLEAQVCHSATAFIALCRSEAKMSSKPSGQAARRRFQVHEPFHVFPRGSRPASNPGAGGICGSRNGFPFATACTGAVFCRLSGLTS